MKFLNWSLTRKIGAGVFVALLILLVLLILSLQSISRLTENARWAERAQESLKKANEIIADIDEGEDAGEGYLLTSDETYLARYHSSKLETMADINDLHQLMSEDSSRLNDLARVKELAERKFATIDLLIGNRPSGTTAGRPYPSRPVSAMDKGVFESIRQIAAKIISEEEKILEIRRKAALDSARRTYTLLPLGSIASFLILMVVLAMLLREIAKRHEAELALRKMNEHLEQLVESRTVELQSAVKELESFSYSISHDLKAPLRTVSGLGGILLEDYAGALDERGRRYIETMRSNAEIMGKLINALLAFTELNRGSIEKFSFHPAEVIEEAVAETRRNYPERNPVVRIGPMPDLIVANRRLLREVFSYLLSNSFKFTSHRAGAEIEIGSAQKPSEYVFYVRDNGVGFDMRFVHKLFGVFERLHSAEEYPGTGIGLSMVHRIIDRHGGRVWAEGEEGKGATFSFAIPNHAPRDKDGSSGRSAASSG